MLVSTLNREYVNSLESLQNWLKKYCKLEVSIKYGYFWFSGDEEYTVVPSFEGFKLYWHTPSISNFLTDKEDFEKESWCVKKVTLGAKILEKWGIILKKIMELDDCSTDAATISIGLKQIKDEVLLIVEKVL